MIQRRIHVLITATAMMCLPFTVLAADTPSTKEYKAGMEKMHHGMDITYTGNTDTDFVAGMIPHHQGAVDMATTELKYGKDPKMRKLAEYIIYVQNQEIAFMKHWLETRGNVYKVPASASTEPLKQSMHAMHEHMMIPYSGNADIDFARGMIPHHQGAVDMADVLLRYGKDPELKEMAWEIIRSQGQEIRLMQNWLEGQPASNITNHGKHSGHHASH